VPSINDAGPPLPVPAIRFLTRAFPCFTLLLLVGHVRTVPMHTFRSVDVVVDDENGRFSAQRNSRKLWRRFSQRHCCIY
jgi:hypothetical protein